MAITDQILEEGRNRFLQEWKRQRGTDYIHKCADGCGREIGWRLIWCRKCGEGKNSMFVSRFN